MAILLINVLKATSLPSYLEATLAVTPLTSVNAGALHHHGRKEAFSAFQRMEAFAWLNKGISFGITGSYLLKYCAASLVCARLLQKTGEIKFRKVELFCDIGFMDLISANLYFPRGMRRTIYRT